MDTASKNIMGRTLLSLIRAAQTVEERQYQTLRLKALGLRHYTPEMQEEIQLTQNWIETGKPENN